MTCRACGDRGVFRIRYRDDTPSDLAICRCLIGQRFRGDARHKAESCRQLLAAVFHLPVDRVQLAETLLEGEDLPVTTQPIVPGDVTEAGRRQRTAKL